MLSSWVPPSTVYVYPTASWFTEQHEYVVPAFIDTELPSPQADDGEGGGGDAATGGGDAVEGGGEDGGEGGGDAVEGGGGDANV